MPFLSCSIEHTAKADAPPPDGSTATRTWNSDCS